MAENVEITAEVLIPLVQQRPVLWNKNSEDFKDKAVRTRAWREICCVFKPDFKKLPQKEMKEFVKAVSTKWVYVRDAYIRSYKKKMIPGIKKSKPYVYTNLLSFITDVDSGYINDTYTSDNGDGAGPAKQFRPYQPPQTKNLKIENVRTIDEKVTPFAEDEHPHISFMRGIIPSLATFDEDENLEFQAGVVELIQKIRRKRQGHQEYPYDIKVFRT